MQRTLVLFLLVLSTAAAQNGESIISRFGIGDLDQQLTSRQRGMGGVAASLTSTYDVSSSNPASWTGVGGLRLQGGLLYEFESYSKNSRLSTGSMSIKALHFSLPLEESMHARLVAGFVPVSRVGYQVRGTGSVNGESYRVDYLGRGGVSSFTVGAAIQPLPALSLGAMYRFLFGTIDREQQLVFDNGTTFGTKQWSTTSHNGSAFTVGAIVTGPGDATLGFTVAPAASLAATRDYTYRYSTNDSTVSGESGTQDIPLRYTVGVSSPLGKRFLVAAEYTAQDWSGATVFNTMPGELTASYRIGAGVEWRPSDDNASVAAAAKAMMFRLGFYQQKGYVALNGEEQKETFITIGAGLPILGMNRADASFELGWRGASEQILGSRLLVRFAVTVSVGESWFVRKDAD